jgi:hypothetical protein
MTSIEASVKSEFKKEPTDLSRCCSCSDQVFTDINRLYTIITVNGKDIIKPSEIILCNNCLTEYYNK